MLVLAGDNAYCSSTGDAATAALIAKINPVAIQLLGDTTWPQGAYSEFVNCYDPTWGKWKSITHPGIGNHEYLTAGAAGYQQYFGAAAGPAGKFYYSYDLGGWHIVVINSNCSQVGGCQAGSPQETWLKADLAAHPNKCTLAVWHHPRFSSGEHGDQTSMTPIWQDLYDAKADLVMDGHDHDYERFAPQTPTGALDTVNGIREFVVGTGGINLRPFYTIQPNSQVRISNVYGVMKLTLYPGSYDFQFVPQSGQTAADSGSGTCH